MAVKILGNNPAKTQVKTYRKFNLLLLATALMPVFSIGVVNLAIDPYGVLGTPTFPGVNWLKAEQDKHNQLFKPIEVIRLKPKTIIIGSSRTIMGLDPNHPGLIERQNAYNLGIPGMHIKELNQYLKHAIANQPDIKQIAITLDFFMFNGNYNPTAQPNSDLGKTSIPVQSLVNVLFSIETLKSSGDTFTANRMGLALIPYYSRGMRNREAKINPLVNQASVPIKDRFKIDLTNYLNNPKFYRNYRLDNSSIQEYKEIIELCKQKNIDIKVLISPEHATQLEAIRAAGLWSTYEQWKIKMTQITPVWDFSNYNSMTTEPIGNKMKYFLDGTHYPKEVGNLVLNRVLSYNSQTVNNDFGVLMTPQNITSHLAKVRANREVWAKKYPDVVKWVASLKLPAPKR